MGRHEYPRLSNEDVLNRELERSLELWEKALDHGIVGNLCSWKADWIPLFGGLNLRPHKALSGFRFSDPNAYC